VPTTASCCWSPSLRYPTPRRSLSPWFVRKMHPRSAGQRLTAPATFERLAGGCLNMIAFGSDENIGYVPTTPSEQQQALLQAMQIERLVDPLHIAASIKPRPRT